jgi:hypothetical protein
MDKIKYLTFLLFALFCCSEIYLRIFKAENMVLHQYPKVYRFDPDVGYTGIPNMHGYIRRPSISKHFVLNNFGYYGPDFSLTPSDSIFRIVVVGSSVVQGVWANQKESFVSLLNDKFKLNKFKVEVINCGISGGDRVFQNIKLTKKISRDFKPNLILFELFLPFNSGNYYRDTYKDYSILFTGDNLKEIKHSRFIAQKKVDLLKKHDFITHLADYSYLIRFLYRGSSATYGITYCWKAYAENSADTWLYYTPSKQIKLNTDESLREMSKLGTYLNNKNCKLVTFEYGSLSFDKNFIKKFSNISLNLPLNRTEYQHELDDHPNHQGDVIIAESLFKVLKRQFIPDIFFPANRSVKK